MTSKIIVNTIEADTGISSVTFASNINLQNDSSVLVNSSGIRLGTGSTIAAPSANEITLSTNSAERFRITSDGKVSVPDNGKFVAGAGDDLQIYHDGSHSYIDDSGTGDLRIRSNNIRFDKYTGETIAQFIGDGRVELYYDNSKKFETTSYGAQFTDNVKFDNPDTAGRDLTWEADNDALHWEDNTKATFGANNDLSIFHNGTHNFIDSAGSADLYVRGANILLQDHVNSNRNWLIGLANGTLELYHSGNKKLETKSDGINVTGEVQCDSLDVDGGHINLESGYSLQWGDSHERIEQSDQKLEFFTNNSQKMTLSGSKLGLGTSSNLNGLLTLHQDGEQLFLKQTDGDSGFLLGSNNTNGNLNFVRRSVGSNTTLFTMRAGGGLTFNGDSAAANALDDYEEGTWTPTVSSAGSVTGEDAKYTKIGNLVHVYGKLTSFTNSTSSNTIVVSSLPYTAATNQAGGSMFGRYLDRTAYTAYVYSNKIEFYSIGSGNFTSLQHSHINNSNAVIYFQATYNVS